MKIIFTEKIIFSAVLFFSLFALAESAEAATWYASNNGSGTACTNPDAGGTACTPAYAAGTKANPGDAVILKNGIYTGSNYMLNSWKSGTPGLPITVRAETDGGVTIDGQQARQPLMISGKSFINVEGIMFKNGYDPNNSATGYVGYSKNINIKRCSFLDPDGYMVLLLHLNQAQNYGEAVVVEDAIVDGAWGEINTQGSEYGIIRRVFTHGAAAGVYLYNSNHMLVENLVSFSDPASEEYIQTANGPHTNDLQGNGNYNKVYGLVSFSPGEEKRNFQGFMVSTKCGNPSHTGSDGQNCTCSNCPSWQSHGNEFVNNAIINPEYFGGRIEGDDNVKVRKNTLVWTNSDDSFTGTYFFPWTYASRDDGILEVGGIFKDNSLLGNSHGIGLQIADYDSVNVTNAYNNYHNLSRNYYGKALQGTGEIFVNPAYNTATYGNGAYLMVPPALKGQGENGADIGAKVLYRYQDGVLTNNPLWPWPMEDRILAETGISVTYESGGGIWKTLDGVYDENGDTTPPAAPSGLSVL